MSVVLYRTGATDTVRGIKCEMGVFDEYSYLHNLDMGWFYSPEECYIKTSSVEPDPEIVALAEDLIDGVGIVPGATEDIRARAKKAGIRNWHNKKIETLLNELDVLKNEG